MNIQDIIQKVCDAKASDVFIVAGTPVAYKVKNVVERIDDYSLTSQDCTMYIQELYRLAHNIPCIVSPHIRFCLILTYPKTLCISLR